MGASFPGLNFKQADDFSVVLVSLSDWLPFLITRI